MVLEESQGCFSGTAGETNVGIVSRKGSQHGGAKIGEVKGYYQANFASWIDGALPFLRGIRAYPLLIQRVIPWPWEVLGPSHDLGLGVAFMPFLVRCLIGIDYILDIMFCKVPIPSSSLLLSSTLSDIAVDSFNG
jgi:hypothetical protein